MKLTPDDGVQRETLGPRAARDKERYDLVLIDPPSTSSAAGVSWALGRDYPEPTLVAQPADRYLQVCLLRVA